MNGMFLASLRIDLRAVYELYDRKVFKVVADTIRSGIKNEHGFYATKGLTDVRLGRWPYVIRFANSETRKNFIDTLTSILQPDLITLLSVKNLRPATGAAKPVLKIKARQ